MPIFAFEIHEWGKISIENEWQFYPHPSTTIHHFLSPTKKKQKTHKQHIALSFSPLKDADPEPPPGNTQKNTHTSNSYSVHCEVSTEGSVSTEPERFKHVERGEKVSVTIPAVKAATRGFAERVVMYLLVVNMLTQDVLCRKNSYSCCMDDCCRW